jgi:hypothetical protein
LNLSLPLYEHLNSISFCIPWLEYRRCVNALLDWYLLFRVLFWDLEELFCLLISVFMNSKLVFSCCRCFSRA